MVDVHFVATRTGLTVTLDTKHMCPPVCRAPSSPGIRRVASDAFDKFNASINSATYKTGIAEMLRWLSMCTCDGERDDHLLEHVFGRQRVNMRSHLLID